MSVPYRHFAAVRKLEKLRDDLFAFIKASLEEDGHCKHYEGTWHVTTPGYFDKTFELRLDCYLLGPTRHYFWQGKDLMACVDAADKDVRQWMEEDRAELK